MIILSEFDKHTLAFKVILIIEYHSEIYTSGREGHYQNQQKGYNNLYF